MENKGDEKEMLKDLSCVCEQSKAAMLFMYREIARLFEKIIGVDFDGFVGDTYKEDLAAKRPTDMVDVLMFGDYYFSMRDILTVVTNLVYWLERYGSVKALGEEIFDWYDYIADAYTIGKTKVSLFAWLSGCPRKEEGGGDGTD